MSAVLLDTHAWAWSLSGSARLSARARDAMAGASAVLVSPITFFEIAQKVRLGKWPEMIPFVHQLPALLAEQGGQTAALDGEVCLLAGLSPWPHRDPFDRLLAATALRHTLPIVSADTVFDGMATRIW